MPPNLDPIAALRHLVSIRAAHVTGARLRHAPVAAALVLGLAFLTSATGLVGTSSGAWAEAPQQDGGQDLAVVVRAGRQAVRPGQAVGLAAGFQNRGGRAIHLDFSCAPPVDIEIYGPDGSVVWQHQSDCGGDALALALEPRSQRLWELEWPGATEVGEYKVYAILHTEPREAVAGPITIRVTEEEEPHPTERPRETDHPHVTATPGLPDPSPTAGHALPDDIFTVAEGPASQRAPDVDGARGAGDCAQLVVWLDEGHNGIMGRFVSGSWKSEPFLVSGDAGASGPPRVAYHTARRLWLVVWSSPRDAGDQEVRARYVACRGLEGSVFTVGSSPASDLAPDVARWGETFVVTWHRHGDDATTIQGAAIDGQTTVWQATLADGPVSEPVVACRSASATTSTCVVAWTDGAAGGRNVLARRWWVNQERVDDPLNVAGSDAAEFDPSIAAANACELCGPDTDRGYLVTWTRDPGTDHGTAVWARLVHSSGEMIGGDAFQVSGEGAARHGDASSADAGFQVVWSEIAHGAAAVRGRLVALGHTSLGAIRTISRVDEPIDIHPAAVTVGADWALAVWQEGVDDLANILGRFVNWPDGGRVVLIGRVQSVGTEQTAVLSVAVERVLEGRFGCAQAHVRVGPETLLPDGLKAGDRVYIIATAPAEAPECTLALEGPGAVVALAGPERLFAPYAVNPSD